MPLANDAAKAMRKPIITKVIGSAVPMPMAAVEAINKFEGPANGIKLNPNDVAKMIMNSIIDAIPYLLMSVIPKFSVRHPYKCKRIDISN